MIDLNAKIKESMKAHDQVSLKVYREIKSQKLLLETAKNAKEYDDASEIKILQNMIKQRMESMQYAKQLHRDDLIEELDNEIGVIQTLIPAAPTEEEIEFFIIDSISSLGGEVKMGDVIKMVKSKFPSADGKLVSEIVRKHV